MVLGIKVKGFRILEGWGSRVLWWRWCSARSFKLKSRMFKSKIFKSRIRSRERRFKSSKSSIGRKRRKKTTQRDIAEEREDPCRNILLLLNWTKDMVADPAESFDLSEPLPL
jgi:hypothetical protein